MPTEAWPLLALYYLCLNLFSFAAMAWDKSLAKSRCQRIPERALLLLDFLGGSLGGMIAMYLFRHKTLHLKFRVLPVLFLLLHLALLLWLFVTSPLGEELL